MELHFHERVEQVPFGINLSVKVLVCPCSTKYVGVVVKEGPIAIIVLFLSPVANEVSKSAIGGSSGVSSEPLRTEEDHGRETCWKLSLSVNLNTPEKTITIWVLSKSDGSSRASLGLVAEEVN